MTDSSEFGVVDKTGWRWDPDNYAHRDFPMASDHELVTAFSTYSDEDTLPLIGVVGAYTLPTHPIRFTGSIDIDDVLCNTRTDFHKLARVTDADKPSDYSDGTWMDAKIIGEDLERYIVGTGLKLLINDGHIQPVANIDEIADILRSWRQDGAYLVANTSRLEGCEVGTIVHTLEKYLPDVFNAIVFPRNHDGRGRFTKAHALGEVAASAGLSLESMLTLHIDDTEHHHEAFMNNRSEHGDLLLAGPKTSGLVEGTVDIVEDTPYETFRVIDALLKQRGIIA